MYAREPRVGDPISAATATQIFRWLKQAAGLKVRCPLLLHKGAAGMVLSVVLPPVKTFRIVSGSNPYAAQEIVYTGGKWIDGPLAVTTTHDGLIEMNGNGGIRPGTCVTARRWPETGAWLFQLAPCAAAASTATPAPVGTPTPATSQPPADALVAPVLAGTSTPNLLASTLASEAALVAHARHATNPNAGA